MYWLSIVLYFSGWFSSGIFPVEIGRGTITRSASLWGSSAETRLGGWEHRLSRPGFFWQYMEEDMWNCRYYVSFSTRADITKRWGKNLTVCHLISIMLILFFFFWFVSFFVLPTIIIISWVCTLMANICVIFIWFMLQANIYVCINLFTRFVFF